MNKQFITAAALIIQIYVMSHCHNVSHLAYFRTMAYNKTVLVISGQNAVTKLYST